MKNLPFYLILTAIFFSGTHSVAAFDENEQIIIFVQKSDAEQDRLFRQNDIPKIKKLAREMDIPVSVSGLENGAPPEVKITPFIVYQNYRGRSFYQGRSNTYDRIRNFIRTSRYIPQGKELLVKDRIPIWEMGRTRVWSPLKVASVSGSKPKNYNDEEFKNEAMQAIYDGFHYYKEMKSVSLERADRGFYMDFYPWLSENKTMYLSLAVFSQFHCKDPVFHTQDNPLVGTWENRKEMFQKAAGLLERVVLKCIRDSYKGDGFIPVDGDVKAVSWEALGFPLPPEPKKEALKSVDIGIPHRWVLKKSESDKTPMVQFRFPAPLDHYSGEAKKGSGEFELPENLNPSGAKGFVVITLHSVTMGDPDLDKVIQSSLILNTKEYPVSKFVIEKGNSEKQTLNYGSPTPAVYQGTLNLKEKSVPLTATVEIEPVLGDKGEPLLIIRGGFEMNLKDFMIDGPDGPEPANHTLLFDVNFTLTPKTE